MDYDRDTRLAYRSADRARDYRDYQSDAWTWGRFVTAREQRLLGRILAERRIDRACLTLDAPCGTGVLARTLKAYTHVFAVDISLEMMRFAVEEYAANGPAEFVQADLTAMPFGDRSFPLVLTLGFMHRVPAEVRRRALAELHRVCAGFAIVSFSLTSAAQRVKQQVLRAIKPAHVPAPCAMAASEAELEIRDAGFHIMRCVPVLRFLSSEWLYVLSKDRP